MTEGIGAARRLRAIQTSIQDALARRTLGAGLGETHAGDRDLYETFGYPVDPEYEDFFNLYDRGGLAGAIVDKPISSTWSEAPQVTDSSDADDATEFEEAVEWLFDELSFLSYLERLDTVSALGRFGLLYLGVQDGSRFSDLDQPVEDGSLGTIDPDADYDMETNPPPLSHFGIISEGSVMADPLLEDDPTNPRYNLPQRYLIQYDNQLGTGRSQETHWTRVIHVASGLLENEWEGKSILRRPYNRLTDWEKTVGSSAEAAYQSADRKLVFNLDPEMGNVADEEDLEKQVEALVNDVRPYLQTQGMSVDTISGETQDPSGLTGVIKEDVAGQGGVPQRMLTGSERGDLASSQDQANFAAEVAKRQEKFAEPQILRPILDRLILWGILPAPRDGTYDVEWSPQFELTELETASAMETRAKALSEAAPMGDPGTMLNDAEILEWIVNGPDEEMLEEVKERTSDTPADDPPDLPGADDPPTPPGADGPDDGAGDGDLTPDDLDLGPDAPDDEEATAAWWSDHYGDEGAGTEGEAADGD